MKQIGGDGSALFSLTAAELEKLREAIESNRLSSPISIHPEGPAGGLVRFRSIDDAKLVMAAIA